LKVAEIFRMIRMSRISIEKLLHIAETAGEIAGTVEIEEEIVVDAADVPVEVVVVVDADGGTAVAVVVDVTAADTVDMVVAGGIKTHCHGLLRIKRNWAASLDSRGLFCVKSLLSNGQEMLDTPCAMHSACHRNRYRVLPKERGNIPDFLVSGSLRGGANLLSLQEEPRLTTGWSIGVAKWLLLPPHEPQRLQEDL
jgi:hypothetical protein